MIFEIGLYGWASLQLGNNGEIFRGNVSYLTDAPFDILHSIDNFFKNGSMPAIAFDEEGSDFIMIIDELTTYVIAERDKTYLFRWDIPRHNFIEQIVNDINAQFNEAVNFIIEDENNLINQREIDLRNLIDNIRRNNNAE